MKRILVTGGSGFVGRHLIKELLKRYPDVEVTSLSRSEGGISKLQCEVYAPTLRLCVGDIRDETFVRGALKGKDTVIHLAAMKRVDLCEEECEEGTTINVLGTLNMLRAFEGETFIQMSTDKAVEPCNCYGATKLVCERLVQQRASKANGQRYMIVRSGNILGSTGSVIDIWVNQIKECNEITVTNPDMMRFYTSVDGVVKLYIAVLERGENGKLYFTPHGNPVILKELIGEALRKYGNGDTKVRLIGLRTGERMEEKMRSTDEPNVVAGFEHVLDEPVAVR